MQVEDPKRLLVAHGTKTGAVLKVNEREQRWQCDRKLIL